MPAAPRVWDAFPYWREGWAVLVRLRLWAGSDVSYNPVALIGDRTHRGDPHPWPHIPSGLTRMRVTLDAADDWGRERQQRDAVTLLLAQPDDLILLTDADEFVDPAALPAILEATATGPVKLRMALYACGTRWRHRDPWRHAAACRARDLPEHPSDDLRLNFALPKVDNAGWHLTYFGSDTDVDAKLSAFAHAERDTPEARAELAELRDHGGPDWSDDPLTGPLADALGLVPYAS